MTNLLIALAAIVVTLSYSLHLFAVVWGYRRPKGDVVVVPGCRVYDDGSLSPAFQRRLRKAVWAMEHSGAARLLITGGLTGGPISEAEAGATFAMTLGVPDSAIIIEDNALNTMDNACFAADLLGEEPIIIVSDAYHIFRCYLAFGRYFEHTALVPAGLRRPRWRAGYRELFALVKMWQRMGLRLF